MPYFAEVQLNRIISYGMLKVKASDPNRTFGTEFDCTHFFHPEAYNIYVDYILKKKLVDIHI